MLRLLLLAAAIGCGSEAPAPEPAPEPVAAPEPPPKPTVKPQHTKIFAPLPEAMPREGGPERTEALVDLGRMLYYEPRLSSNGEQSCNTCHQLDKFGVDNEATSLGVKGERGGRNSPTTYNAAGHIAQFWDGREPDVEAQAKGPILNPVEMDMPNSDAVVARLRKIEGYRKAFAAAFPDAKPPITYDNLATAIGAFERGLVTPAPFDRYLAGEVEALTEKQRTGLDAFIATGCVNCHAGPYVGGQMYQKLGLTLPYETEDLGRYEVTKQESDKHVFKVPSLRNIAKTGPYLHDGSIADLDEMIRLMGRHQLAKELDKARVSQIRAFLDSLTGEPDAAYIAKPELPAG